MPNVFYNHGVKPIFITVAFEADPNGGPAIKKQTYCIIVGSGIDLDILNLKPEKPKAASSSKIT